MSDPYAWLDGAETQPQAQPVEDPYAWLDGKPKATPTKATATSFDIDFSGKPADVRKAIAKLPKAQRTAARKAWADVYVAKERKDGGIVNSVTRYADDVLRNVARGTPVGTFLDEANAFTAAPLSALGITDPAAYEEAREYQRAKDRAIDKESTRLGSLPGIGDVTVGGIQKLAGGIASAPVTPILGLFRGSTALPTMGNLAATGAVVGGVYGAGEGESVDERLANAGLGSAAGAVAGPAGYLIGQGAGRAVTGFGTGVQNAINRVTGNNPQGPLARLHSGAVERAQRAVVDDGLTARTYGVERARLGPEAMLADMGDNLRGQAGAIASAPGRGQSTIKGALRARDRLSPDRLETAVNQSIGRPGARVQEPGGQVTNYSSVDDAVEGVMRTQSDAARPFYQEFYSTRINLTPRLRTLIERAQALQPRILDDARDLMRADGLSQAVRGNNSALLDYTRRALDSVVTRNADRDPNLARIAGNIARALNTEIDRVLLRQGSSSYANARAMAQGGFQFRDGVQDGLTVLGDTTRTAAALRRQRAAMSPTERAAQQVGVREDVRRRMANATSAFGETAGRESTKGRTILSSSEARAKLNEVIGPDAARLLTRVADAEGRFAGTSNAVMGNSATAGRQAAQKEFPNAIPTVDVANEIGKKTTAGATAELGYRIANYLLRGALDERRLMIAADTAQMLVARGTRRDEIVNALLARARQQGVTAAQQEQIARLAAIVARGITPVVSQSGAQ